MVEEINKEVPPNKNNHKIVGFFALAIVVGLVFAFLYSQMINYTKAIPEIRVPNIVGLDEQDALAVLKEYKLNGNLVGKKYSEKIDMNKVIEMAPEPGSKVKIGRRINYTVSLGKEGLVLDDIRGLTLDDATNQLREKGITVKLAGQIYSPGYTDGVIASQDPDVGMFCTRDSVVKVYLSKGYPVTIKAEQIEPGKNTLMVKISLVVEDNAENKKTNIKIVSVMEQSEPRYLYNEDIAPGKELYFEWEEPIGSKVEVYYNNQLAKSQKVVLN